jgi:protein ImuA
MTTTSEKKDIISRLQKDILQWEGFVPPEAGAAKGVGLGPVEAAFPNGVFPAGAVHEFVCPAAGHSAATAGFITGVLGALMQNGGACLWAGIGLTIFPPGLAAFGIEPDRVIFVDLKREKDVLWVAEEALRCGGLAAVIAEVRGLDFAQSRRLQLAVERSRVTGFILRNDPKKLTATACTARWKVTPISSELEDDMPGVGFPRWNVELLKVRNGNPGVWQLEWHDGRFNAVDAPVGAGRPQEIPADEYGEMERLPVAEGMLKESLRRTG